MAPRRPRSTSNAAANTPSRAPTSSPQLRKQFAASIDSIYHNNITVLKRRDPSILSIMDQFSHVCLYHFNGKKWEKQGFEGSMFLVEHQEYPPYGMYILNRMGTGDYERKIYPEDDLEVVGDYLMYRCYPDYTKKRLEMHLPYPLPPQYKAAFDQEFARDNSVPEKAQEDAKRDKKGNSLTLGLWMFPTDVREPLKDVLLRLHSYVKRGEPYPEQFRYGPGRPPPNPSLGHADYSSSQHQQNQPNDSRAAGSNMMTQPVGGQSEVDRLFAKLQPSPAPVSSLPSHNSMQETPRSVQSWFAALAGEEPHPQNPPANIPAAPVVNQLPATAPAAATPPRGMALLNTIFASVSQPMDPFHNISHNVSSTAPTSQFPVNLPPRPEQIQIVSPKPQSSTLPQILNQNVISTLLGLAPDSSGSRSSSAALSSTSSRQSIANRYEGDNEQSESEAFSSRTFPANASVAPQASQSFGNPSTLPSVAYPPGAAGGEGYTPHASVQGDVTPRPSYGAGPASPAPSSQRSGQSFLTTTTSIVTTTGAPIQQSGSVNTVSTSTSTVSVSSDASGRPTPRGRALVPFTTDSELWPYPRVPLNDNEQTTDANGDVVELDFSDTRALSDPNIFQETQAKQLGKKDRKKKSRKERAADREKDREAIENGWDDPTKGQVTLSGATAIITNGHGHTPSSPSVLTNGDGQNQITNGVATAGLSHNGVNGAMNGAADGARVALLHALATHPAAPSRDLPRQQFVQEVLGLIQNDESFVNKLYQEYVSPSC